MTWLPKNTARKVRALAKKAGHDLTRLDAGGDAAIASCKNAGCTVMVEIRGEDDWRFIRLGAPHESCSPEPPASDDQEADRG